MAQKLKLKFPISLNTEMRSIDNLLAREILFANFM